MTYLNGVIPYWVWFAKMGLLETLFMFHGNYNDVWVIEDGNLCKIEKVHQYKNIVVRDIYYF
jgi:hypothetical protein